MKKIYGLVKIDFLQNLVNIKMSGCGEIGRRARFRS